MILPIAEPKDGFDQLEKMFLRQMIISTYSMVNDPIDKFILLATHECSYTQQEIGQMIGISQVMVHKKLKEATERLKRLRKLGRL